MKEIFLVVILLVLIYRCIKKKIEETAEVYNSRGATKGYLKDFTGAILDFSKAIKLNPKYAVAYYNRGNAKCDLKDCKDGIADYNKAIELNPELKNPNEN